MADKEKSIILVDDHPVMRFGLAQLIASEPDLKVIGEAGSAREAMDALAVCVPDLMIVDISLPDKNGLELIKDARSAHPDIYVLVVSMHDERTYAERVLRAGGRGYIMKEEAAEKLVLAIRAVMGGKVFVSDAISRLLIESFSSATGGGGREAIHSLTDRELEVFQLLGEGLGSKEIAARIHCSPRTVDAHRLHIREKLGLNTGRDVVREAVRWTENNR